MQHDAAVEAERTETTFVARLGKRVEGIVSRKRGSEEGGPEDLWDPAGVPGPLDIVLANPARRLQWRFRAAGRR